jgi:hypothetical protein
MTVWRRSSRSPLLARLLNPEKPCNHTGES